MTVFHADLYHSYELKREIKGFSFWHAFIHCRMYLSMKQKNSVISGNLIIFWCRKQSRIFILSRAPSLIDHSFSWLHSSLFFLPLSVYLLKFVILWVNSLSFPKVWGFDRKRNKPQVWTFSERYVARLQTCSTKLVSGADKTTIFNFDNIYGIM